MVWLWLLGCGGEPSAFEAVTDMTVRQMDPTGGLKGFRVDSATRRDMLLCITKTREITADELEINLLPKPYLIALRSDAGERSYELLSRRNLRDSEGRYYSNDCIYTLIRDLKA